MAKDCPTKNSAPRPGPSGTRSFAARINFDELQAMDDQVQSLKLNAIRFAVEDDMHDQAFDMDGKVGERSAGQYMGDVAEGVLMHIEPRIGRHVDLPVGDVLAVVAARRHAQDLDHPGGRRLVAIGSGMGNSQAHGFPIGFHFRHSGA